MGFQIPATNKLLLKQALTTLTLFIPLASFISFLFLFFFIYLTEKDTAREGTQAGGVGEGEAGFPLSREPDAGLDPRTLGS